MKYIILELKPHKHSFGDIFSNTIDDINVIMVGKSIYDTIEEAKEAIDKEIKTRTIDAYATYKNTLHTRNDDDEILKAVNVCIVPIETFIGTAITVKDLKEL